MMLGKSQINELWFVGGLFEQLIAQANQSSLSAVYRTSVIIYYFSVIFRNKTKFSVLKLVQTYCTSIAENLLGISSKFRSVVLQQCSCR